MKAVFKSSVCLISPIISGAIDVSLWGDSEKTEIKGRALYVMFAIGEVAKAGIDTLISIERSPSECM